MFRMHEIVLNAQKDDVLCNIAQMRRNTFLSDHVDDSAFSIHRSVKNGPNGMLKFADFRFSGCVTENAGMTVVTYHVYPPVLLMAVFAVLFLAVASTAIMMLFMQANYQFFIGLLLSCVALGAFVGWQCSECRKHFESKLKV